MACLVYLVLIQATSKETNINHTKSLHLHMFGFHFLGTVTTLNVAAPLTECTKEKLRSAVFLLSKGLSIQVSLRGCFIPDTHINSSLMFLYPLLIWLHTQLQIPAMIYRRRKFWICSLCQKFRSTILSKRHFLFQSLQYYHTHILRHLQWNVSTFIIFFSAVYTRKNVCGFIRLRHTFSRYLLPCKCVLMNQYVNINYKLSIFYFCPMIQLGGKSYIIFSFSVVTPWNW